MRVAALFLAALAACARMAPVRGEAGSDGDDSQAALAADERSSRLEQELSALFTAPAPRDCSQVCPLVREICDLSDRICSIAGRHRDDADLGARCAAGRQRCQRARDSAVAPCSCRE